LDGETEAKTVFERFCNIDTAMNGIKLENCIVDVIKGIIDVAKKFDFIGWNMNRKTVCYTAEIRGENKICTNIDEYDDNPIRDRVKENITGNSRSRVTKIVKWWE